MSDQINTPKLNTSQMDEQMNAKIEAKIIDNVNMYLRETKISNFKNLVFSLIIITIAYIIADNVYESFKSFKDSRIIYGQLSTPIFYLIIILGIMIALDNLGFSKTTLVTLLGTIGFGLALALQNLFTNVIAGIYIGFKNLFKIGDYLEVNDSSGHLRQGIITDVDLFVTTIQSEDGIKNIIPNTIIENNIIYLKKI